jgi:hypothetical protein
VPGAGDSGDTGIFEFPRRGSERKGNDSKLDSEHSDAKEESVEGDNGEEGSITEDLAEFVTLQGSFLPA